MIVTMRNWERCRSTPKQQKQPNPRSRPMIVGESGPELLLTPMRELLTNRDESPVRRESLRQQPALEGSSIPIEDILVVDVADGREPKLHLTTMTFGYYEFTCNNRNGHDILLAFLKASVSPERILDGRIEDEGPTIRSSSSVTSCLDVDALTAAHLQGRADSETWPEKMSRRVGKVVSSLTELSGAFCDLACCLDDSVREKPPASPPSSPRTSMHPSRRTSLRYSDLEMDENDSQLPTVSAEKKPQPTLRRPNNRPLAAELDARYDLGVL